MSKRTYIVTLRDKRDLANFYDEMEFAGSSNSFVPGREVKCRVRRNLSRNTHYNLTPEEAVKLAEDPRVLAVELPFEDMGIIAEPFGSYTRNGNFSKSTSGHSNYQWGHLHCAGTQAQRRKNSWGRDTTNSVNDSVTVWEDGTGVDVVIVDSGIVGSHPSWNSDPDGTSGTDRFIPYQWFNELNTIVNGIDNDLQTEPTGTIPYTDIGYHGMHVAGTVAGSLRGWAPQANIYNLNIFNGTSSLDVPTLLIFDYLRAFHQNKPVDPKTGLKRPTVTNHSWGFSQKYILFDETQGIYDISSIVYRGTTYDSANPGPSGWTNQGIKSDFGLNADNSSKLVTISVRSASVDADVADAIEDGIIIIGSAGNNNSKIDLIGGTDYNNRITYTSYSQDRNTNNGVFTSYYMRGSSPGGSPNAICVGSLDAHSDFRRSSFSNHGPRVDVFAPGSYIVSAFDDFSYSADGNTAQNITDPRNNTYFLGVISGTSMASPQVAGIAACYLTGKDYRVNTAEILDYVKKYTIDNEMSVSGSGYQNATDLHGAPNKVVSATNPKPSTGLGLTTTFTRGKREVSGMTFPRSNVLPQKNLSQYVFHINETAGEYSYIRGIDDLGYGNDSPYREIALTVGRDLKIVKEDTSAIYLQHYYPTGTTPAAASANGPSGVDGQGAYNGAAAGDFLEWENMYTGIFALSGAGASSGTQTFNITTTSPSFSYYTLSGTDRLGSVSGNDPTVTVEVGDTINFNLSNVDTFHPFYVRNAAGNSNVSTPAASNQGSTGNTTVSWTPNTAGTYSYICGNHSSMKGTITVNTASPSGATVHQYLTVGGAETHYVYLTNNQSTSYFIEANNTSTDRNGTIPSGTVNPTVNINRGDIVIFIMNANGHPFWIKTSAVTGGSSTINQCPDNGAAVGPVVWNTAEYSPGTYYYICQYHSGMGGQIIIS